MSFAARANSASNTSATVTLVNNALYTLLTNSPAQIEINNNGSFNATDSVSTTPSFQYNWLSGGTAANYDVRVTPTSGTFSSGTTGTWLNLAATRSWNRSAAVGAAQAVVATFEIRNASTLVVLATASIELDCDRT